MQWGRDRQISLDTAMFFFLFFKFSQLFKSKLNDFLRFSWLGPQLPALWGRYKKKRKKLWENPRGNNTYQQTSAHSFRHQMGQQIKLPQYIAWAEFQLPRQYAGCVAALQQLAEPAASPRKTKTTQTLSLIYRQQERSVWTWCTCCSSASNKKLRGLCCISVVSVDQ